MDYYTEGVSRRQIRARALDFRALFGLEREARFPVVEVLEALHCRVAGFHFEVVGMGELHDPRAHAETDILGCCIRLREDVYERACEGRGRDRLTIAHEMGHLVLHNPRGIRLYRSFGGRPVEAYRDPEWQASCFAGELLVPKCLVAGMGAAKAARLCGVSYDAAAYQLNVYDKEVKRECRSFQQKKTAPRTHWQ